MRILDIVIHTVPFGAVIYPTVRIGTVLKFRKSYGAVRGGFRTQESYGAMGFGSEQGKNLR